MKCWICMNCCLRSLPYMKRWKMCCSNGCRYTEKYLVYADKTQMNRLFTNLLQNALEACHDHEICVISVQEELKDDQILIRISDNGEGIPEQMQI